MRTGTTPKSRQVYTRKEWQAARDKAGGKPGMVKGVDVGVLLDAFHKAKSRDKSTTLAALNSVTQAHALMAGLVKYRTNPAVAKNPKLKEIVGQQIDNLDREIKSGAEAGQLAVKLTQAIRAVTVDAGGLASNPFVPEKRYGDLVTSVKKVGTMLRDLSDRDDVVDPIRLEWLTTANTRLSAGGAGGDTDDERAVRLQSVNRIGVLAKATEKKLAALKLV